MKNTQSVPMLVHVPAALRRRVKVAAALTGTTMASLVGEAVERFLNEEALDK